jgi:hypothetical protein
MYFSVTARRRVEMFGDANDLLLVARASKASAPASTSSSICFEVRLKRIQSKNTVPMLSRSTAAQIGISASGVESFDDLERDKLPQSYARTISGRGYRTASGSERDKAHG